MQWGRDAQGNSVCDAGKIVLASYSSKTTGEPCFRVMARRGDEWEQVAWGSSRSSADAMKAAEDVAREAVLRGLLVDDGSTDAMLTRLALFSPVTGAELDLLIRRTREWAEKTCRDVAESEIARVTSASLNRIAADMDAEAKRLSRTGSIVAWVGLGIVAAMAAAMVVLQ